MTTISVILPDGSQKVLKAGATGMDLAKSISEGLAKVVVAVKAEDQVLDLQDALPDGARVELLKADSQEGLDTLRHSCEHILATAVCRLFKGAQVTMGPKSHENEFYYDFDIGRPFTPADLEAIENEMRKIISEKVVFAKSIVSKEEAKQLFEKLGQRYKPEILDWIPGDSVSIYQSSDFIDLCRGPHLPHAGFIKAFKLLNVSGSYWRADANREMLQRISGIAFASKEELEQYLFRIEEAKKRDHRKLGTRFELFSVSDRYDAHEYAQEQEIELLVTGSVRKNIGADGHSFASALLDENLLKDLRALFAPKPIHVSGYSIHSHAEDNPLAFDVQMRLFVPPVAREIKQKIDALEEAVSKRHPEGRIRLLVESRFTEEVGPGLVLWLPKGGRLRTIIEDLSRKMHFEGGYEMVFSPHLAKSDLWKVSGHWGFYRESMFSPMVVDGQEYVVKPMNCPFHVMMFKNRPRSYRELPCRFAELGTVYRYELAGVMHGLMRVRGFTQDDAHLFCRWDQIDEEIDRVIGFILKVLRTFGFSKFEINLSTRPEKYVGDLQKWEKAEKSLMDAVKRHNLPFVVDEGGGAFYGPKIDIKLKDSLDRSWQCSTVQLDFNLPERFGLTFTNHEGKAEQPVMLHRALLGSLERFVGVLIEEYAGAFPMWLSPEQVRILPISERHAEYAERLRKNLVALGLRVNKSDSSEKLGAKIREAQLDKVPVMLVVGDKEAEVGGASVRLRSEEDLGLMDEAQLKEYLLEAAKVPFVD